MNNRVQTILYVDDDPDDREFLSDAFKRINPSVKIIFAEDGQKALDFLTAVDLTVESFPCLIVLDINMPYLNGRETFEKLRANPVLKDIPVVIFTSSENPADKALFKSFGIELITKPSNISFMNEIASRMIYSCEKAV